MPVKNTSYTVICRAKGRTKLDLIKFTARILDSSLRVDNISFWLDGASSNVEPFSTPFCPIVPFCRGRTNLDLSKITARILDFDVH